MRRYHNEKRTQIAIGNLDEAIRRPSQQKATPSQPMMFVWHAPISSSQGAGTPPHSQSSAHISLTASDVPIRPSKSKEQCYHCLGGSTNGKQPSSTPSCVCMQPHPQPGLEPSFLGTFPVDRRSLDLLQFSEFLKIPYSAWLSATGHLLSSKPSQE